MGWKKYFLLTLITLSLVIFGSLGLHVLGDLSEATVLAQTTGKANCERYYQVGKYDQAIGCFQESLDKSRKIKNLQGEADSLTGLGNAYRQQNNYDKAIDFHRQALARYKEINNREGEAKSLTGLGSVYHRQRNYHEAIYHHQQALAIYKEINNREGEAECLMRLGDTYQRLSDYHEAIYHHQQSLAVNKEIKNLQRQAYALTGLGNAFFRLGNLQEAETALRNAMKIWEGIRGEPQVTEDSSKVSMFERQALTYHLLQEVLVTQEQPEQALEIAERGRNRALVEILFSRNNQKLKGSLTPPSPTLEEIKQIAQQQNATLVEYSIIHDYQLYIWVIPPQGEIKFHAADLPKDISLKDLVQVTRQDIGVRGASSDNSTSQAENSSNRLQELYQILIQPIAEFLPQDKEQHVIFIPHQELFLVPFVALQNNENDYLIEKHTILTAPSIQALSLTRKDKQNLKNQGASIPPRGKQVLIVGNPTMPSLKVGQPPATLEPLPGAEEEAKKVAKILHTTPLLGAQATKSVIVQKMASAKVIHLATHGLLDKIKDADSPGAIALAPSTQDNGFLTTNEIMERFGLPGKSRLQAELVVLSACDTGGGDIKGEGVVGLSRAFIAAGVPTVVVSLWKVPDGDTAKLMKNFYNNVYVDKFDKAKAMRKAMLSMLNKENNEGNPHPEAWAAFTVIGQVE